MNALTAFSMVEKDTSPKVFILVSLFNGTSTFEGFFLTKRLEKKLDGNYTRMLRAILNKPGGNTPQSTNYVATCHPSRKLSKLDEPDMQETDGEAGTSSLVMYSYRPPHMAVQKQDDQLEHTYSSSVRIRVVALKTCQRRWTIGRSGERGSGISVLVARHDDDDEPLWVIQWQIHPCTIIVVIDIYYKWFHSQLSTKP